MAATLHIHVRFNPEKFEFEKKKKGFITFLTEFSFF